MHVRRWSRPGAPVMVLVHGVIVSSRYMIPLGNALAETFDVYALDAPGHGRSIWNSEYLDTEDLGRSLAQFLEDAGLRDVTIVANSYGCQVAVEAAHVDASRIKNMVFIGPTLDVKAKSIVRQAWRLARGLHREPYWFLPVSAFDLLCCGFRRALFELRDMIRHDMSGRAAALGAAGMQVAVIRGHHDFVCPPSWAKELATTLRTDVVTDIDGGAHDVHARFPERIVPVVQVLLAAQ